MNETERYEQLKKELEEVQRELEAAMRETQAAARDRETSFRVPPKKPPTGSTSATSLEGKDALKAKSKRFEEADAGERRLRAKRDRLRKELNALR